MRRRPADPQVDACTRGTAGANRLWGDMFGANYGTLLKASGGGELQLAPPLRPSSRAALAGHSASLHSSKQAADSPSGALVLSPDPYFRPLSCLLLPSACRRCRR